MEDADVWSVKVERMVGRLRRWPCLVCCEG